MTYQEMIAEIPQLTIEERLGLLEMITQSLRASMTPHRQVRESVVDHLYGAFKTDGPSPTEFLARLSETPPTDIPPP